VGLALLEPPAAPLVSLEEAQVHLRAENPQEGALVQALVTAATAQAEAFCRRRFVTQRWRATFDRFPAGALVLPYPPLVSVESLSYVDSSFALQVLAPADYVVRSYETPGEIVPARAKTWPAAADEPDVVAVEFTCGYGDPAAVPEAIRRAVLLIVGTLYANRETVAPVAMQQVPHSAEWLLGPYRVVRFAA
jgi:uncharacterized phiE125 gp8 family phage protein